MEESMKEFLKVWALITFILIVGIIGFLAIITGISVLAVRYPQITLGILVVLFIGIISLLMTMGVMENKVIKP